MSLKGLEGKEQMGGWTRLKMLKNLYCCRVGLGPAVAVAWKPLDGVHHPSLHHEIFQTITSLSSLPSHPP